jgi:hypothetical protein
MGQNDSGNGSNNGAGGNSRPSDDGWDAFDWLSWGDEPSSTEGHGEEWEGDEDTSEPHPTAETRGNGRWVSEGGVLRWERPGEIDEEEALDAASEARSPWATDDLEMPPGAPQGLRARAVRAWLLRQRAAELDAIGTLLLRRRRLHEARAREDGVTSDRDSEEQIAADDPLILALTEHQAATEEYERLLTALDESAAHSGPARVLIEFYLHLTERLAELAAQPEAPAQFADALLLARAEEGEPASRAGAPPTPHSTAVWRGHAEAALQTRRRVERVTAPEPED